MLGEGTRAPRASPRYSYARSKRDVLRGLPEGEPRVATNHQTSIRQRVNSCAYRAGIRTSRRVGRDVRPRRCTYQLISTATTCVGCSNTGAAATRCGACDAPARSCFRRERLTSLAVGSGSRSAWCASSAGSVRTGRRLGALLLPMMFESKTKVASK